MIVNNCYIKNDAINFIRHIRVLREGYHKEAYPTVSIFITNHFIPVDISDFNKIDLSKFGLPIDDEIPTPAYMGYPCGSSITYYINFKNLVFTQLNDNDVLFQFSNQLDLYIYNKEFYKTLLEDSLCYMT